jgi:ribose transport system substrate-binding protein
MRQGHRWAKFCLALTAGSAAALTWGWSAPTHAADKPLLGLVSITATEDNNQRFIKAATAEAEKLGWQVSVIDAQGSADQANAAIQNLVQRKAAAIVDMVFPVTSVGAGVAAANAAHIPLGTWGGGMGPGIAAVNGSGGPMATPIIEMLVKDIGGKGSLLELTYHTGKVCRDREEVADAILAKSPDIKVTKNEVHIPGFFQDGAQYATAWLASHPAGSSPLAIWGCWDDPALGAISALRQQARTDVKVYGENGNAQAMEALQKKLMNGTAWQDSASEGVVMTDTLVEAVKAGATWQPKSVEVPAVVVTQDNVADFVKQHPEALGK